MHKLSIITINYNNLEGLKKTIESVVNQTWKEFEYIVIDGDSKDGSAEYIQSQNDKIDYWVSEPDKGVYNAMNKGIVKTTGDYLLFLNSGDWLVDDLVFESFGAFLNGADVVYGNLNKVFPIGDVNVDKGIAGNPISLRTFFLGTLNHGASFIKRSLFDKYGLYDESLLIVSDWKWFLVALGLNNAKVVYVDRTISYFDMTGISNKNLTLRKKEREIVIESLLAEPLLKDLRQLVQLEQLVQSKDYKYFQKVWTIAYLRRLNIMAFRLLHFFKFDHKRIN